MSARKIENYDRVLVVEGYSDLHFYAEVLEDLGKHDVVFIEQLNGKTGLRAKLETLVTPKLLASKIAICFVFDADDNAANTRRSLESILSAVTQQKIVDGRWTTGNPKIGLMIVPGGDRVGEIETLVWDCWSDTPANVGITECVKTYIECMKAKKRKARSPDKGLIGALLSILSDEDPRLGPAARDEVFDLAHCKLEPLRGFLSGL